MTDPFGIRREQRIKASGVRNVYTPNTPIRSIDLFFGRQEEVQSLIENLTTPGQHVLLFGDRGVGKSSLANIAADVLLKDLVHGDFYEKRCDSTDTFSSIVAAPLRAVGIDVDQIQVSTRTKDAAEFQGGASFLKAKLGTESEDSVSADGPKSKANSPSWVAEQLRKLHGLMLIDEVDALRDVKDRHLLAELVKQLSDAGSPLKLLIVGIAESGADLTAGHPSVQRCLKEIRLSKMRDFELAQIVVRGEKVLPIKFDPLAVSKIAKLSSGYAHFTHLLALKAAEDAIAEERRSISPANVEHCTRRAVNDAEGSLKRVYDDAVRSSGTDEYRKILCSAAMCGSDEFTASNLRDAYERIYGSAITQNSVNNYLKKLVSPSDGTVMRRIAKGVYKFNDPRMPSYIRIANIVEAGQDLDPPRAEPGPRVIFLDESLSEEE